MLSITPTPTPEEAAAIAAALGVLEAEQQAERANAAPPPSRWPHADPALRQPDRPHTWGDWWR